MLGINIFQGNFFGNLEITKNITFLFFHHLFETFTEIPLPIF